MIGFLKGKIAFKDNQYVYLDVNGVGYKIFAANDVLSLNCGENTTIYTYTHVREDALELFGFINFEDLKLFEKLLGVSGIGPKTADELLNQFETLENLYQNLEKIKEKNTNLALKLAQGAESAGLAKKLATIITDVPFQFDFHNCTISNINKREMRKEFENYSIRSLIKRLIDIYGKEEVEDEVNDPQLTLLS